MPRPRRVRAVPEVKATPQSLATRADYLARFSRDLLDREGTVAVGFGLGVFNRGSELAALLFVFLEQPQRRSDDLTDVVVSAVGDAVAGKFFQSGAQRYVGGHRRLQC